MKYTEKASLTDSTKKEYVDGINRIITQRQERARQIRGVYIRNIFANPEKYREDFKKMLGWPLVDHEATGLPKVSVEKLSQEDDYCVYRMQFEILDGLKMTGLFFQACDNQKKPLVILQHGGMGTPELISGFYGSTCNYNDMLHRVRSQGVHVFAPQLLLWSDEYPVEYDRKAMDAQLKRVGSSITAVEVYGITRILDYFETQDYVSSFGMVGLSYGGFYTLFTAAVDPRIQSAISCSFFNKRDAVGWSDWTWFESAQKFDDAEVACLIYPRSLCIAIGNQDPLFDSRFGMESFEKVKDICGSRGTQWIDFIVFDGDHEFHKDDTPIKRLVQDLLSCAAADSI
jgi:hypothetical protein